MLSSFQLYAAGCPMHHHNSTDLSRTQMDYIGNDWPQPAAQLPPSVSH